MKSYSKGKGKITAIDHGGLMLAASEVHPEVAARRDKIADEGALHAAASQLEQHADDLTQRLGGMVSLFDDELPSPRVAENTSRKAESKPAAKSAPASAPVELAGGDEGVDFDAQFNDDDQYDGAELLSGMDGAEDDASNAEFESFNQPDETIEDFAEAVFNGGGLHDGDTEMFEGLADAGPNEDTDAAPIDLATGDTPDAEAALLAETAIAEEEFPEFEGLQEDQADINAQISGHINAFNDAEHDQALDADFAEFEEPVADIAQPEADIPVEDVALTKEEFANAEWEPDGDISALMAKEGSDTGAAPVGSPASDKDHLPVDPILEGDYASDEDRDGLENNWPGHDEWAAEMDQDGEAHHDETGSRPAEVVADWEQDIMSPTEAEIPAAPAGGQAGQSPAPVADDHIESLFASFEDDLQQSWSDEPASRQAGKADVSTETRDETGLEDFNVDTAVPAAPKDVDGARPDVSVFDLSDDIDAKAEGSPSAGENEGETKVKTSAKREEFDEATDAIDPADAKRSARKVVSIKGAKKPAAVLEEDDEDEDDGFIVSSAAKKRKMMMLAASVGVAALLCGGGYALMISDVFGNAQQQTAQLQTPAPAIAAPATAQTQQVVAPATTVPAAPSAPLGAPNQSLFAQNPAPAVAGAASNADQLAAPVAPDASVQSAAMTADLMAPETQPAAETAIRPEFTSADPLATLAAGLEGADSLSDLALPENEVIPAGPLPTEAIAPKIEMEKVLEGYIKRDDFEAMVGGIDQLKAAMSEFEGQIEMRDERIEGLEASLAKAGDQASRAEALALAQNEVLVKVIRVSDKIDMAESLIVDLSRRMAALETTDPADRVAVERSLEQIDAQVKNLTRDIGLIARVAINGSPAGVGAGAAAAAPTAAAQGGDTVFAEGQSTKRPAQSANVPANAKKGDFVQGYGYVLDIIPTSDGANLIVMENGSVLK